MANAAKLVLQIDVDDKGNPVLKDMDNNLQRASKSASQFGTVLKNAAASVALWKGITILQDSVAGVAKEVLDFNLVLKQTQGITKTSETKIEALKDLILELGNFTEFTASEIAGASLQITKMGVSVKDQMSLLPSVIDLATASVVELEDAVHVAAQTAKSFGVPMQNLNSVANIIQTTVSNTAIGFDDFAESMKFIAPIAKTAGLSIEDTAASIGILGDVGIKGSLAGTSLKNIITNLLQPSEAMADALERFGLAGEPLPVMLAKFREAGLGINDFLEGFNLRALGGALALSDMADKSEILRKKLVDQSTTVQEVSKVIRDSWINQLKQLQAVIVNTAIEFSRVFEDVTEGGAFDEFKQFWIDLQADIRNNRKEIRETAQTIVNNLVGALRWFADNKDLFVSFFKILLARTLITNVTKLSRELAAGARAIRHMNLSEKLAGGATGIRGIASALGPMTLAIISLNEALTIMAENIEGAADAAMKAGGDITQKGFERKKFALEEIRPFVLAVQETEKVYLQALKDQQELQKISKVSVSINQDAVKDFAQAGKELKEKLRELKKETGLDKVFFDMFKTTKAVDKAIFDFGMQIFKAKEIQRQKNEQDKAGIATGGDPKIKGALKDDGLFINNFVEKMSKGISDAITVALPRPQPSPFFDPSVIKSLGEFGSPFGDLSKDFDILKTMQTMNFDRYSESFKTFSDKVKIELPKIEEVIKDLNTTLETSAEMEEFKAKLKSFVDENKLAIEKAKQDRLETINNFTQNIVGMIQQTAEAISFIMDVVLQNEMKALDKREADMNKRKEAEIKKAGNNKRQLISIERRFAREEEELAKQRQEKEAQIRRKQKAFMIAETIANTAMAVMNALATVKPFPLAVAASITAGATGAAKVAAISAQNFRSGGLVTGGGNMSSDSVPANLSVGEFIVPARQVQSLGGERGVKQALADDVDYVSGTGKGTVVLNIDTFIGTEEFKRDLFLDLEKEAPRWLSGV